MNAPVTSSGGGKRRSAQASQAQTAPPCPIRPLLAEAPSLFMRLERQVELEFRPQMLAALQRRVDEVAGAEHGKAHECEGCHKRMERKDARRCSWLSRLGRVHAKPVRYRCRACRLQRRPLLAVLGVEAGRICGSLARLLALLGTVAPFQLATELAKMLLGVDVSPMSVWRSVQRLGEACVRRDQALSDYHAHSRSDDLPPGKPAEIVVLGVDGCVLGMQVRPHRRRFKTPEERLVPLPKIEDGQFREVKTGVIFKAEERFESSTGRRSVLRRVVVTCLGEADAIFGHLWARLQELGWLGSHTMVVVVGDGAEWIWKRAEMFTSRCEILDFWHAVERAWEVARLLYGEGSTRADRWTHRLARDLRAGDVGKVIKSLRRLRTTNPEARAKLKALIGYYENNRTRMRYDEYLRLGYGIGSGAVESAHKQVVHARLRQAGMRWSVIGAQRLLALRVALLNGEWQQLDHLPMLRIAA